ncbi:hemolysin family protein [Deferribacterales bacterium Es71-Z0220]|uniref:hemolysin family protein n=1 Tax=Deferrivibrio essentukiensis TaxID=2880922 RepID=UPI001F61DA61|nr:hemolysin family protein [Deferrivibrio essentukiensis]MBZ4672776.1 magnesium/cobalt efflux protein [Deferribacteraceae bacterium]MCB4204277.1 hemolysin family protein [Deferrivibrio essentukiensis]
MDSLLGELITIGVCIIFSGFFSSSETALTSLSELKVKHLLQEKGEKAKDLELWLMHPNKVLNTILIGNNIVNIFGSVLAAEVSSKIFGSNAIAIATGIMTFLVIIFGEIAPKTFAKHNAESLSLFVIKILKIFYFLFYPISFALNKLVKMIIKLSGGNVEHNGPKITEDEIEFLISVGEKEGVLENQKKEMLHNIFEISDTLAKEVMVPRTDLVAIKYGTGIDEILNILAKTEYSRIPVYDGKMDNILGILYVKDLLKYVNEDIKKLDIKTILRKPYFVPSTKRIDDLLREFQLHRIHFAIVVDEYGGVDGIVTLEDILEEIVGEIRDEYDKDEKDEIIQVDENIYEVDPKIDIDDFNKFFGLKAEDDLDYETLGGLIFDLSGRIPEIGDVFSIGNLELLVKEREGRRIKKVIVKVIKNNKSEEQKNV